MDTIATASELVASDRPVEALASKLEDPAVRDMAVAAIRHLSPSGHAGITAIDLLGRRVHHRVSLTTETRRHARRLMAQPPSLAAPRTLPTTTTFVGTVRELDASRFEIRNVEGLPGGVRCAHELDEQDAKLLVDLRVRVKGRPEYGPRDDVRLLWVDELEILD